jgi:hypothetical protein
VVVDMKTAMRIQDVKEVVEVSSSFWKTCKYCSALKLSEDSIEQQVNHYLGHGLKLLHVGTESSRTAEGQIWHSTVAVLGKY